MDTPDTYADLVNENEDLYRVVTLVEEEANIRRQICVLQEKAAWFRREIDTCLRHLSEKERKQETIRRKKEKEAVDELMKKFASKDVKISSIGLEKEESGTVIWPPPAGGS